mmetsp:Transcript_58431/g.79667  ORF Transcript_58431/g.79667 Transcript_58431/m.79667 type:complete len:164 (-) Transcript_58431:85-576(-)|eukprot:CAMPEP_0185753182 /NCGR_PEP_ID=MMETSP1174-20130828/11907_1 /TAXON_ID=35687 /ORGANISM="Dictyocha speculum, Strain CCMP1381" /LENGTH=163 /DNA_ID=CAMNT_0028430907 /DNA_START=43 /DNA_END=534 /DNA_ORIENTATION=+
MRHAEDEDVGAILELIQPLIAAGMLLSRNRAQLLKDIKHTYVNVRDEAPIACGMLVPYGPSHAEISCLAVKPRYRGNGRGDNMLTFLERVAMSKGIHTVFILTTQTMHWFTERGFDEVTVDALPDSRRYNWQRKSKIFMKHLESSRQIDSEEYFLLADDIPEN